MNSVEIMVGHRWKDDVRYIDSLRPRRPAESSLDLLELRDIIDIVVDGTNLTAPIPEEAIFGLVGNILSALVKLVDETSRKGIIEFHHEPWELVLVPDGTSLRLSLYSIDRRQRVIARDREVDGRAFIDAICEVAEQMLTDLFGVSERFSSHRQVRRISQALARLQRAPGIEFSPADTPPSPPDAGPRLASTSTARGLTLGYRFNSADPGLLNYRGEHVFDLHALLFDGIVQAEFGSETLVLATEYPFLAISSVLVRTRQLFNQLESQPKQSFVLDESLTRLHLNVEGQTGKWLLCAQDAENQRDYHWESSPSIILDALVSMAELFVQDLLRTNPNLSVNQRFVELEEEVQKLRRWHRDLCGNNVYHERPEDYLRRLADVEPASVSPPPAPTFSWPLASVHTIFPRRNWSIWAERIDFTSLILVDEGLLIPTPHALRCVHPATGEQRWRFQFSAPVTSDGIMAMAGSDLVASDGTDRLVLIDRNDGQLRSSLNTDTAWRELVAATQYRSEQLVVVGRRDGHIAGFDTESGDRRWLHSTRPDQLKTLFFHGPLICAQSAEGVITALNPRSGETVWKIRTGGTPELEATIHQGRIYTITHDPIHRGSTLYALYPFTGRTIWQLRLPGYICGPPSFIDQWMIMALERHGQLRLVGIDLEAIDPRINWQLKLSSAGIDRPTPVLPVELEGIKHGLVRTDRAELSCFRVADGQLRWRVMPATETLLLHGNLPLFNVRDALVNVSESVDLRHLDDGRLLHSFEALEIPEFGFLASPFCLLLGERASRTGESDRITAHCVDHFLTLIADNSDP